MARGPIANPKVKKMHPAARRTPKSVKTLAGRDPARQRREKTRQKARRSRLARNHPEKLRAA
ncbi:hypothetical protein [Bradyrhizobium sp. STM 3562]|uniref:hypothetical protein n=1 Tax=Bradyrhizobium sp. STM 3562 TaxID=578924 RepID=UPI00388E0DE0